MSKSEPKAVIHSRYNVSRIKCTGKESLRRRIGLPFPMDTKGKLKVVTNADETFHAGIVTKLDPKLQEHILTYVI